MQSIGIVHQQTPFVVPTQDGKLIEEHFGLATGAGGQLSIAHMVAPPGWSEPAQTPEFDEYTLVSLGRKQVEANGQVYTLHAGQSIRIPAGTKVRYANPFDEPCEYWSVCLPAFSPDTVHRDPV